MKLKRLFCIILALALVLAFSACGKTDDKDDAKTSESDVILETPPASDTDVVVPENTKEADEHLTSLSVGGIPVVRDGAVTGLGYSGVKYADGVLTLDSVALEDMSIEFDGDLVIELVGASTITNTDGYAAIAGAATSNSTLTFRGEGSLTISAGGAEVSAVICSGELSVEGGNLDVTGADKAISCKGEIVFAEGWGYTAESTDAHVVIAAAA